MTRRDRILTALTEAFTPREIFVVDDSHRHEGHAGWRDGGETHFRIKIVAAAFDGRSRVARHRLVNEVLRPELESGLHALAIDARGLEDAG